MKKTQLEEIEYKEKTKCEYFGKKIKEKEKHSITDFYPDLKLNGVYGYFMFGEPVWVLIPFLDTVIVNIPPYKSKIALEKKIGLSLEQLLELRRKGRVQILIDSKPTDYVSLDYLDPIIETSPCSDIRIMAFSNSITKNYAEYYAEGEKLFKRKLGKFAQKEKWGKFVNHPAHELEGTAASIYAQIMTLGYNDLGHKLVQQAKISPTLAFREIYIYSRLLTDPVFYSLDGVNPVLRDQVKLKEYYDEQLKWAQKSKTTILPFDTDVGKTLLQNLPIEIPRNLEQALDISTIKSRKALRELNEAIDKKIEEGISDKKIAMEIAILEMNEELKSMDKFVNKIQNTHHMSRVSDVAKLTVGITGATASLAGGEPLISSMAASIGVLLGVTKEVVNPISEFIAKIRKPRHVVTVFDIRKSLKK